MSPPKKVILYQSFKKLKSFCTHKLLKELAPLTGKKYIHSLAVEGKKKIVCKE